MRRNKILSVFGAAALTVASMAGCTAGGGTRLDPEVTRPAITVPDMAGQVEERYLSADDNKIEVIQNCLKEVIRNEENAEKIGYNIELRVSGAGKISVDGLNSITEDFLKRVYKEVTGNENGPLLFLSKAYKEGSDTVIKCVWNHSKGTQDDPDTSNQIAGSKYYRSENVLDDDRMLKDMYLTCTATLCDEKYYSDALDTVTVTVKIQNKVGEITVEGLPNTQADFITEIRMNLAGSENGKIEFKSDEYEGSTAVLSFQWYSSLYTWQSSIRNDVKSSAYYKKPSETEHETQAESQENGKTELKTTIEVMAFTNEVPNLIRKYMATHPEFDANYEVNFTVVATSDNAYQNALEAMLRGDTSKTPDMYMAWETNIVALTSGSASEYACTYEELGIDVEQKIREAGIATYAADVTRRDGKVVALPYEGNGCMFIYNRDVAKDVFGDDKPETVEAALGHDWESFFKAAEKCKKKGYAIVSGADDIWHSIENSADQGWVVDGKLYIDPKREAFLDHAKRLHDNDYYNDTKAWTEGWYADMAEAGPKKVLGFYGPMWFINYTLKDNCGYSLDDDGITVKNMGTYGRWAVCRPNVGAFWSGTWLVANKKVLEDTKLKDGVRELIEYITLDTSETGLQYEWANAIFSPDVHTKDGVTSRVVLEKSDGRQDILGGQDSYPLVIAANAAARGDNLTEYDEKINLIWRDAVYYYTHDEMTREEAIDWFKAWVRDSIPDIKVK